MGKLAIVETTRKVARPLKVLVPLIQEELIAGIEAGKEHFIAAGEMLNEAKDGGGVAYGSWGRWLRDNFKLSHRTANDYMLAARRRSEKGNTFASDRETLKEALGYEPVKKITVTVSKKNKLKALFDVVDRVNVTRLSDERKSRDEENRMHRELALKLIDSGYRAMATRLHPDQGGSREAMERLNTVRDTLKEIAATRRFI